MGDLPKEKNEKEFLRWSHCNEWPTQVEKKKSDLIVMGDLPRWKNGLIVMGDQPR
jgi:hypothetical protein